MESVNLPNTDITVSRLCFGTGAFGTSVTGDRADRLLAAFVAAGGNFFDTAHCYAFWVANGLGASERELGASLRRIGAWDNAVVATKGGHPDGGPDYRRPADFLSETVVHSDIEESLNRLGTDCIDLYYLHRDDGTTPVGEIIELLNREIEGGRIRYLGASNWSVERIAEANAHAAKTGLRGFAISQVQWSLSEPDWTAGPDPTMRTVHQHEMAWHVQSGIPIAAYSATGNGFFAKEDPGTANPVNRARWERVRAASETLGCTPTQLAVAWLLHQRPVVLPVFSTTNEKHLAEVLAVDTAPIDLNILAQLDEGL